MMTSKYIPAEQAFVWIWLPQQTAPICAGRIRLVNDLYQFKYSKKYLLAKNAIPLSALELPLVDKTFIPSGLQVINSCLRDAAPDAWGRRVINNEFNILDATEIDYMLLSGSNRIGALDFQTSDTEYVPRVNHHATLQELMSAAEYVEKNLPIPQNLQAVLLHGTSIGGARPKALISNGADGVEYIAKFSSSTDFYNVIKSEYVTMTLAKLAGINVANVSLTSVLKKDVLMVERFDRENSGQCRKLMLSALSILGLSGIEARYASYTDFAEVIRHKFTNSKTNLLELYKRLVFNILVGNTDDHARNHAAFWDGKNLTLTPAYDICPLPRAGYEATQAMAINGKEGNLSKLSNVLSICEDFQLSTPEAQNIIDAMVECIRNNWDDVCDKAQLSVVEKSQLWEKSILNPFCFQ